MITIVVGRIDDSSDIYRVCATLYRNGVQLGTIDLASPDDVEVYVDTLDDLRKGSVRILNFLNEDEAHGDHEIPII